MFRFFTSDFRRNIVKIICLSVGLSVGFLLVAKIYFQQTYDSFLPDIDRIYHVKESVSEQGEYREYDNTPSGIAHALRRLLPEVETATRISYYWGPGGEIRLDDGRTLETQAIAFADSCLFDVFQTPVLVGDPREALAAGNNAVIPRSLAEKIGGDVIGMQFYPLSWGELAKLTIAGVYEDFPLNSTMDNCVFVTMSAFDWQTRDGLDNLIGGDRFRSYVILNPAAKPEDLHPRIMAFLEEKLPQEAFTVSDFKIWLRPLKGEHASQNYVKSMSAMLALLAVVMLMCAALNYLLIVVYQLASRNKEMAIRKCYGTGPGALFARVMGESIFFLVISMGLALLIAFSFTDLCKELLGYSPRQLFSTGRVWITEGIVCLALLIITGVIPSVIYSRTPVVNAFRGTYRGRKGWKLALLAIQFFATGMILSLLVLVARQYTLLGNLDMGYEHERLGYAPLKSIDDEKAYTIRREIEKLPFVEGTATAWLDISEWANGNMLWTEGHYDNQLNVGDMMDVNPELFDVAGIKFLQGGTFHENPDSLTNEAIVEERAIPIFKRLFGATDDNLIGKTFYISGHGDGGVNPLFTIVGVTENIRRGGYENDDTDARMGVYFNSGITMNRLYIRFSEVTPENLKAAQEVITSIAPENEIILIPFSTRVDAKRGPIRRFGTAVLVVGIVIMIIALIGLIGYVADEVNRRAKEIAIRKVNGTSASKILKLFCIDIIRVALPSLIAGGAVAIIIGKRWLEQFSERVSLSPLSTALCLLILLILIVCIVTINSLRVARSNPVDHLRSE